MKKIIFYTFLATIISSCSKKNLISYRVSHSIKHEIPFLNIQMEFRANPSGETILLLQDKAWGQEDLHNTLSNLKSEQALKIIKEKDSNRIIIKHSKNINRIQFSYTLQQDRKGSITKINTYRPVIQEDYFHVFSHNLFMLPKDYVPNSNTSFDVEIEWVGFKDTHSLINSFDTNKRKQKIENTNEEKFHNAVFTGGDYRSYSLNIKGNKVVFGIRGEWTAFQDSTIINILEKTLIVQRDFWKDHTQKYFAIIMTPYLSNGGSFQGTGLTNSFNVSASNNKYLEVENLAQLFNHELQHNWTGLLIKNDNEEAQYWFSEGFTDYFTIKNMAKNNIYSLNERYFIKEFNKIITDLYTSPVKEAPNKDINYTNYWSDRHYGKLPYRRGAIFAFYLDHKIKQESNGKKSLDDLMFAIKKDAQDKNQRITHSYFISKSNEYLNEDIKPFFDKHIENGKLYDLAAIFQEFDYHFTPTSEVFDLGFTFTEDKKHIAQIDKKSNAYKSGLRKGDRVLSRNYSYGSPNKEAVFKIKKEGKKISYIYMPVKNAKIPSLIDNKHNKKTFFFY